MSEFDQALQALVEHEQASREVYAKARELLSLAKTYHEKGQHKPAAMVLQQCADLEFARFGDCVASGDLIEAWGYDQEDEAE